MKQILYIYYAVGGINKSNRGRHTQKKKLNVFTMSKELHPNATQPIYPLTLNFCRYFGKI
jgi:hypothetical protein